MATKWGEAFVYGGRIILAIIIAIVIATSLKTNAYFYKDNVTPWLLGIFSGILFFVLIQALGKGK